MTDRSNFRESTDGRAIVATFELPEVDKQDIHISFQRNKLVLTWEVGEITDWEEEDGVVLREHVRKMYHRTLPLPEGTRVRFIIDMYDRFYVDAETCSSKRFMRR